MDALDDRTGLLLIRRKQRSQFLDVLVRQAATTAGAEVETFGLTAQADWSAGDLEQSDGCYRFALSAHCGSRLAEIRLQVPGLHNVLNATAAAALAHRCGVDRRAIADTRSSPDCSGGWSGWEPGRGWTG